MLSDPNVPRCITIEHNVVEANTQGTRDEVLDVLEYWRIRMVKYNLVVGVLWCWQRRVDNVGCDGAWLDVRPAVHSQGWLVPYEVAREGSKVKLYSTLTGVERVQGLIPGVGNAERDDL